MRSVAIPGAEVSGLTTIPFPKGWRPLCSDAETRCEGKGAIDARIYGTHWTQSNSDKPGIAPPNRNQAMSARIQRHVGTTLEGGIARLGIEGNDSSVHGSTIHREPLLDMKRQECLDPLKRELRCLQ